MNRRAYDHVHNSAASMVVELAVNLQNMYKDKKKVSIMENSKDLTVKFWEDMSMFGTPIYEPANDKAFEVIEFMGQDYMDSISDAKMDRIYEWLTNMGIDVVIAEAPRLRQSL